MRFFNSINGALCVVESARLAVIPVESFFKSKPSGNDRMETKIFLSANAIEPIDTIDSIVSSSNPTTKLTTSQTVCQTTSHTTSKASSHTTFRVASNQYKIHKLTSRPVVATLLRPKCSSGRRCAALWRTLDVPVVPEYRIPTVEAL